MSKLNKFEDVDVFASLDAIMKQNTGFYQSDFDIDREIIAKTAASASKEDMPFIYVSGKDVFILPLCYRVGKLFSDFMGFLIIDFPRLKRLYQMVCEVVSSVKSLRQCKSELNICRFIAAPERGHQHFPVRLVRVLDIVKGFF